MTTGSVAKNIVYFSLPYFFSYFLQTLYGMADLFIIGQYADASGTTAVSVGIIGQFEGAASITAVSIGSQVMHMLTVMIVGLAMGTTVTIAQAVGAEDHQRIRKAIGTTAVLFFGVSLVLAVLLVALRGGITSAMETPIEAVSGTQSYLLICFFGIPLITAYNIIASIFRGLGDSKSPMIFIAVACAANIALDYIFIGHFKMGATGAALGTTLSQAVSVIVAAIMIKKKSLMSITRQDLRPERRTMAGILKTGVPISLQDGFIQIAFIAITVIANGRGLNDAAAVGIVEKFIGLLFIVPSAMLATVSAMAAQNIGAKKPERARKTMKYSIAIAVGFGTVASVILQFIPEYAVRIFTSDSSVITLGGQYLKGYVWDCIFAGIHFCFSGFFTACGYSIISFIHNVISITCARIPLSYLTSIEYPGTLFPMGLASPAGSLLSVIICVTVYIVMRRKGKL